MIRELVPALRMLLALTLLTGGAYPLVVTAIAKLAFPREAAGSLVERDGAIVGSALIGQCFADPRYFLGRPSATTPPCNGAGSGGSNLGPTNPALRDAVATRVAALRALDPLQGEPPPVDLVTASASGLDPEISPAAALWQAGRVARARGLREATVRELVERTIEPRTFGVLGEPRVNVLRLNLALDALR